MKRLLAAIVLAVPLLLVAPSAGAHHAPSVYCSSSGDFCTSVRKVDGVRKFRITSFAHRGEYKLCVKGPDGSQPCFRFRLRDRNQDGMFTSSVGWKDNFPYQGDGAYRVKWFQRASRLGPVLGFHYSL